MIKVGISHCLLGAPVRFDGGHKQNRFCKESLADYFQFVPLCPEVGIGMGTPRKTLRLVGDVDSPRAVFGHDTSQDFTDDLVHYADKHLAQLQAMSGYVFCKGSPSCGTARVKVYNAKGYAQKSGVGVFAARVQQLMPLLPIEDDGRLNDPLLRDSFIKRVYIYHEWQQLLQDGLTVAKLQKFHARHKLNLLSHCQKTYRHLGPIVAKINKQNIAMESERYIHHLMMGFKKVATRKNNANVLMHLQGYLKHRLPTEDRQELAQLILDYRKGILPLLSPLTLLKHHFKHNKDAYIEQQSFLDPYPKELAIRVVMQ
ncbi:MAG: DUF1722 domain-containing protein [Gammaproteobacteria bacterium]|nr:DUF1722 domain-containing protein [Gammaproteobacteria bacterium]NVK88907.1 DUF1722 domain-containing protein [Gammaproteobacteria bacterium]